MKLYWLDIETTGLDPNYDDLLEVAIAISDFNTPFDIKPFYHRVLCFHPGDMEVYAPHYGNGLLEECAKSDVFLGRVYEELKELIPDDPKNNILVGKNVHFDRNFLIANFGLDFSNRFSYRHYDIGSLILICKSLGMPDPGAIGEHRAQADIEELLMQFKYCCHWLLTSPPQTITLDTEDRSSKL